jgi:predicted NBD/HSP70 family sugar kinase
MEYYVGLDVSLKQTAICIVDQSGKIIREATIPFDPEAIASFVRANATNVVRIGLESVRWGHAHAAKVPTVGRPSKRTHCPKTGRWGWIA